MIRDGDKSGSMIDFFYYVSTDYDNLPRRVVDGIKLYFGYNAVYTVYDKDGNNGYSVSELYGDSTYARDHILYKEMWIKEDYFYTNLKTIINGSKTMGKYAWRCQDLGYSVEDFWALDLGMAIRKGGFGYKALITCGQPWYNMQHVISIYKPESKGDFSESEMQLFNDIGRLFLILQNSYREHIENDQLKSLLNKHITNMHGCFCVLNCLFHVIFQTDSFARIVNEVFGGELFKNTLLPLVARMGEVAHPDQKPIEREYEAAGGKYAVSISSFSLDKNESYRTQYLYMIKFESPGADAAKPLRERRADRGSVELSGALNAYDLTRREADVAALMMDGLSVPEIASGLCIASATTRTHINNIYKKLSVNSRSEAMAKLMASGR